MYTLVAETHSIYSETSLSENLQNLKIFFGCIDAVNPISPGRGALGEEIIFNVS